MCLCALYVQMARAAECTCHKAALRRQAYAHERITISRPDSVFDLRRHRAHKLTQKVRAAKCFNFDCNCVCTTGVARTSSLLYAGYISVRCERKVGRRCCFCWHLRQLLQSDSSCCSRRATFALAPAAAARGRLLDRVVESNCLLVAADDDDGDDGGA